MADRTAQVPGGLAVRTTWIGLETLRRRILSATPSTMDAPLYPVDGDD
jgi:hypothetical protein